MKTIVVKKFYPVSMDAPFCVEYLISGWGNSAGEVYDLKNGRYLALANSASTGFSRMVFMTEKGAERWVEKRIRLQFPCDSVVFSFE